MINILRFQHERDAEKSARETLRALLIEYKRIPILFLSSGGSAFLLLEGLLLPKEIQCTIGVLDERFSVDPKINNFLQFMQTDFYHKAIQAGAKIIDTRIRTGESLEDEAKLFEKRLKDWREAYPEGKIIITQGIGIDGHTAGIFPYPEDPDFFEKTFNNPGQWVVGYDAGDKSQYPERITITLPFLRDHVDYSIMYIAGSEKKEACGRMLEEKRNVADMPARVIHTMKDVRIFTHVNTHGPL